jgi:hypothetical protein
MAAMGLDGGVMGRRGALCPDRADSARAFRDDRGRFRARLRAASLVGALCAFGFARIWLSTEVASRGSRLTDLREENKILSTDLTVAQSKLNVRRMYGALLVPAERAGFAATVERRTLQVEAPGVGPAPGAWSQLGDELRRSSQLVLTEAFAQGRRDSRAGDHGARP